MTKCLVCKQDVTDFWMYQPWGPGETASFMFPGHQYRGFEVVKVCDDCKQKIERGEEVKFTHKRKPYVVNRRRLNPLDGFHLVRDTGVLESGGTHILVGNDPDWDVMMCGLTIRDRDQKRCGVSEVTVGDLCVDCMQCFVQVDGFDKKDRKTHDAYPA